MNTLNRFATTMLLLAGSSAPLLPAQTTPPQAEIVPDLVLDVRNGDQQGKLLIKDAEFAFESLTDARQSHSWKYADLREISKKRREVSVKPFSGDKYSFQFPDNATRDRIYRIISGRIVSARQKRKS